MTNPKSKFPVPDFPIHGGVLTQTRRNALVRSAMTGALSAKPAAKKAAKKAASVAKRKGK
jgi:hypothetical protein